MLLQVSSRSLEILGSDVNRVMTCYDIHNTGVRSQKIQYVIHRRVAFNMSYRSVAVYNSGVGIAVPNPRNEILRQRSAVTPQTKNV